jgi:hypothetical protein
VGAVLANRTASVSRSQLESRIELRELKAEIMIMQKWLGLFTCMIIMQSLGQTIMQSLGI